MANGLPRLSHTRRTVVPDMLSRIRREIIRGRGGEGFRRCSPAAATADLENSQAFPATARTVRSATQA
jgi:hypothetical protein